MRKREERRAQMAELVREFERSGQSAASFCRRRRLRPHQLSYWRRVLDVREVSPPKPSGTRRLRSAARFSRVRLVSSGVPLVEGGVEVTLPGGERVIVRAGTPKELVRDVLEALRERC